MKKIAMFAMVTLVSTCVFAADWHDRDRWRGARGGWTDGWDCSSRSINFSDYETFVSEEELMIPSGPPLDVTSSHNGGIRVTRGSGSTYRIRVCKAVAAYDGSDAMNRFPQIRVVNEGGRLSVEGPDSDQWLVHFFIEAPQGAKLSLHAYNGPIGVREFSGELEAEVENGPISLRDVSGVVRANGQNGPISISGGSGDVDLQTQNGPLSLNLDGRVWQGSGLIAESKNGPLTIKVPADYEGLRVETVGRSPISCGDICDHATTRWGRDHLTFEFGSGEPLVRASTRNGPLNISER